MDPEIWTCSKIGDSGQGQEKGGYMSVICEL